MGTAAAAGSTPPVVRPAVELVAPDGAALDEFGASVAVSGTTIVVGAPSGEDGAGAAYVYVEPAAGWSKVVDPVAELGSDNPVTAGLFGQSVAISGNTIVVGAPDEGADGMTGAAYVFQMPAGGWGNQLDNGATADLTPASPDGSFGAAVAVSGNTVVVGDPLAASPAAYVFTEPPTGWSSTSTPTATLSESSGALDGFGAALAIAGSTIAVGAPDATVGSAAAEGAAFVFAAPQSGWATMHESATLHDPAGAANHNFGSTVSMSGSTIAVGSGDGDAADTANDAAVQVFTEPSSGWKGTDSAALTLRDGGAASTDEFGSASAIATGFAVAGAPQHGSGGTAYVFGKPASGWTSSSSAGAQLLPTGLAANDEYGAAVASTTGLVVVGAPNETVVKDKVASAGAGAAYVFTPPFLGPQLSSVSVSPKSFRSGRHAPVLNPAKKPAGGTEVRFTLGSAGPVTLTIDRRTGAKLKKLGTVHGTAKAGANRWYFDGKLAGKAAFGSGTYAAVVTATNAVTSVSSSPSAAHFTIHAKPSLTKVKQSHKTWRFGYRLPAVNPKKARKGGTRFSFTLDSKAKVTFAFKEKSHKARKLTLTAPAGNDRVYFEGWLTAAKFLSPGHYRVTISAKNSYGHSKSKTLAFTEK